MIVWSIDIQAEQEVKLKNLFKEWFIISIAGFSIIGTILKIQYGSGYLESLLLAGLLLIFYIYYYFFSLKPLYKKIGIAPYLKGELKFEVSKDEHKKILDGIRRNNNYILCNSDELTLRYLRDNKNPILYKGETYNILPVGIEITNLSEDTIKIHLKTNFGLSFIDHHGRYYLVQQELLSFLS